MFVEESTLSKAKAFSWLMKEDGCVEIHRLPMPPAGNYAVTNSYTCEELERLHGYVSDREWTDLANNVDKLHHGTEKPGLGWFVREVLGKSVAEAQGVSQLAAIFVRAGVWQDNGMLRGLAFRSLAEDWRTWVCQHYESQKQRQSSQPNGGPANA